MPPQGEEEPSPFGRMRSGAPIPVNTRLKIGQNETTASEPLTVGECTQGSVDLVLFILSSITSVEAILQGGSDGENWSPISSTVLTTAGFARFRFDRVAFRFVRLFYTASGSAGGVSVLATTISGSHH
jgi:hypothetical protein